MFDRLRAAIEAALEAATPADDPRDVARKMHSAVLEAKVAVDGMKDDLAATERRLLLERKRYDDAVRRGRLAEEINDTETVRLSHEWSGRHAEKISVLEQKLEVERRELALAEREVAEMMDRLRSFERSAGGAATPGAQQFGGRRDAREALGDSGESAEDVLRGELDREARDALAEDQLRELKKRMGK